MLLPASGALSINLLRDFMYSEAGDAAAYSKAVSLNDPVARYTANKASGAISFSDLYGKYVNLMGAINLGGIFTSVYTVNTAAVGYMGGIRLTLDYNGNLTMRSFLSSNAPVTEYVVTKMANCYGTQVLKNNCRITCTRNSWNGAGAVTGGFVQEKGSAWASVGFSLLNLEDIFAEASYTLTIEDLTTPGNTTSFTIILRLTPL